MSIVDLSHADPAAVHVAGVLEQLLARQTETRDAVHAAAAGADGWKRAAWGSAALDGQSYDRMDFGEAMQGWLVVNDGPSDLYVALSSERLNATGAILAIPAGSWAALPLVTSRLYVGPTEAGSAGSALLMALQHAPDPGFGTLAGAADSASAVAKIDNDTSAVTLLAANAARRGAAIYNDSSVTLYVKLGSDATSDDWTVQLAAGDYYELPGGYAGVVTAVGASASGQARVTEFS